MGRFSEAAAEDDTDTAIDMSPLIDCVFILLIFFIVTTVFVDETGVEVDKPQAASASPMDKNSIQIALTKKGQVVYSEKDIGINGVRSLVKRLIREEVVPVILLADKDAPSGLLVKLVGEVRAAGAQPSVSVQGPGN